METNPSPIHDLPILLQVIQRYQGIDPTLVELDEVTAAACLELRPKTLEGWRITGIELPFLKLGRSVRYRLSDILAYRDKNTFTSTRAAMTRDRTPLTHQARAVRATKMLSGPMSKNGRAPGPSAAQKPRRSTSVPVADAERWSMGANSEIPGATRTRSHAQTESAPTGAGPGEAQRASADKRQANDTAAAVDQWLAEQARTSTAGPDKRGRS